MKTLNRVFLVGSVGRDPEIKTTATGMVIASLSLATSERSKDKQGNWQDVAEWHSLTAFGRTAEVVRDYVKKGSSLHVEGRIQTRSWDKDGEKRYRTEIVVENLILLGGGGKERRPDTSPVADQGITDADIPF